MNSTVSRYSAAALHEKTAFLALGAGQTVCYLFLFFLGDLRKNISLCLAGVTAAFILYGLTLVLLQRSERGGMHPGADAPAQSSGFFHRYFYLTGIILLAVIFRGIIWLSPPILSDDIYRYVWEGKIFSAGFNPFALAPQDQALEQFRDNVIFPGVTRKQLTTIYPPVAQFIFAACSRVSPSLYAMKMTFTLFDLGTIAVLLLTLRALRMPAQRVALYALHPLVIMEFSGSGHLDSAGIFFLMLALYCCLAGKKTGTVISLAGSFLVKFLPLVLLPLLLPRKKKYGGVFLFAATCLMCYLPFISAGEKLFQTLEIYARQWFFNAPLYDLLVLLCNDHLLARKLAGILFGIIMLFLYIRHFRRAEPAPPVYRHRICFLGLGVFLLLTPTLHPWYVCWIIPFLAVVPNRAWLVFSGTVFLSYWVLKDYAARGLWQEQLWVRVLEYVPFYGLLVFDAVKHLIRMRSRETA